MPINENHVDVARYRGSVRKCEFCKNADLPLPLRTPCKFCLTRGYVAQCLNCDGKGTKVLPAVWDNGASEHGSTCDICGGIGVLPATESEFHPVEKGSKPVQKNEEKKTVVAQSA